MRKTVKRALIASLVAGVVYAALRAWRARVPAPTRDDLGWEPAPFPFPPVPKPPAASAPAAEVLAPWVEPVDGECPASHPVKAKLSSGIFHTPGGSNYERTRADRCYVDAAAAEADGLRAAKH
ncbi:MAG: hypothetical protein ABWZ15_16320 [Acidimicrobiia bacterium]